MVIVVLLYVFWSHNQHNGKIQHEPTIIKSLPNHSPNINKTKSFLLLRNVGSVWQVRNISAWLLSHNWSVQSGWHEHAQIYDPSSPLQHGRHKPDSSAMSSYDLQPKTPKINQEDQVPVSMKYHCCCFITCMCYQHCRCEI